MKWAGLETPKCVTVHQRVKHMKSVHGGSEGSLNAFHQLSHKYHFRR